MTGSSCEVWFYHLERSGVEQTLPVLLEKTLAKGWKALVRAPDEQRLDHLDQMLWNWRDDAFLPHGLDSEPHAARQPVLLTSGQDNPNQAQALFLLDGAQAASLEGFERCIVLFDGREPEALQAARTQFKAFKDGGAAMSYWQEDPDRGWEKKA